MTCTTGITGCNVGQVFTNRCRTVMTIRTNSYHLIVINPYRWRPHYGVMTGLTIIACFNMAYIFCRSRPTSIVTASAHTDNLRMIHSYRRLPLHAAMTGTAIIC